MSAQFVNTFDDERYSYDLRLKNARLGLLIWRIANGLVFGFFVFANYLMRTVQPSWPPPGVEKVDIVLPAVISLALLLSSITASRVVPALKRGERQHAERHLIATVVMGLVFFVGIIAATLQIPYSGPYSSIISMMNGFHALHVFVGMLLLGYVYLRMRRGAFSKEETWTPEATVIFWHFVDLMWVLFFLVIYLI